jgi:hypothetical protein
MPANPPLVRLPAVAAPALLFLYGVLRLVDGSDGDHGPGWAWNVGHALFFVAFVLLGALVVGLRRRVPPAGTAARAVADLATAAGLFGAACFLWVIAGDLFPAFSDAAPLPTALEIGGPVLFQLGSLVLLVRMVRARLLPAWGPVLVFLGFVAIAVNLDLIPVGALLIGAGLAPLAVGGAASDRRRTGPSSGAPLPPARG